MRDIYEKTRLIAQTGLCVYIKREESGVWTLAVVGGLLTTILALTSAHAHDGLLCCSKKLSLRNYAT